MRTLVCRTVTAFAVGVVAGAALSRVRTAGGTRQIRPAQPRRVVQAASVPVAEPDQAEPVPVAEKPRASKEPAADKPRKPKRAKLVVEGLTKQQLLDEARKRNIRGRSSMTKAELRRALG